jgi:hypothetical protein
MEDKLYGGQGQYLFWKRVDKDIPETGYSLDILLGLLSPIAPIQRSILNRLRNVFHRDVLLGAQICDRPGNFEDPIMRAGN